MRAHNAGMAVFMSLWQRCVRAVQGLLFPRFWLAVVVQEPLRIVFNSDNREVTVDGTARRVLAGEWLIREGDEAHLIDGWRYLGTVQSDEEIHVLLAAGRPQFDRDTYRILAKYVARMTPLTLRPLSPDD